MASTSAASPSTASGSRRAAAASVFVAGEAGRLEAPGQQRRGRGGLPRPGRGRRPSPRAPPPCGGGVSSVRRLVAPRRGPRSSPARARAPASAAASAAGSASSAGMLSARSQAGASRRPPPPGAQRLLCGIARRRAPPSAAVRAASTSLWHGASPGSWAGTGWSVDPQTGQGRPWTSAPARCPAWASPHGSSRLATRSRGRTSRPRRPAPHPAGVLQQTPAAVVASPGARRRAPRRRRCSPLQPCDLGRGVLALAGARDLRLECRLSRVERRRGRCGRLVGGAGRRARLGQLRRRVGALARDAPRTSPPAGGLELRLAPATWSSPSSAASAAPRPPRRPLLELARRFSAACSRSLRGRRRRALRLLGVLARLVRPRRPGVRAARPASSASPPRPAAAPRRASS